MYINEENKDEILRKAIYDYPTGLTDNEVNYFLKNYKSEILLVNLKEDLKSNNWNDDTVNNVI
mgnify:CR=1 FL=1